MLLSLQKVKKVKKVKIRIFISKAIELIKKMI